MWPLLGDEIDLNKILIIDSLQSTYFLQLR